MPSIAAASLRRSLPMGCTSASGDAPTAWQAPFTTARASSSGSGGLVADHAPPTDDVAGLERGGLFVPDDLAVQPDPAVGQRCQRQSLRREYRGVGLDAGVRLRGNREQVTEERALAPQVPDGLPKGDVGVHQRLQVMLLVAVQD